MVERLAGRGWDLLTLEHERVDFWVERFTTDPDMKARMEGFLSRAGLYAPMISIKLEERDMPHDLVFLAMTRVGVRPRGVFGCERLRTLAVHRRDRAPVRPGGGDGLRTREQ